MVIAMYEGDDDEPRRLLDRSLGIDPHNFIVRERYMGSLEPRWGGTYEQMYAFLEESRRAGLSARHLDRLKSVILADQAQTHLDAEEYPEAERDYRAAMALGNDACLPCLSLALLWQHKDAELVEELSQILAQDPQDLYHLKLRAYAYRRLGKLTEAIADLTTEANAGDPTSATELGRINLAGAPGVLAPNRDVAISWFRKAAAEGDTAGQMELDKALRQ
jgi:hypothetical protein